MSSGTLDDLYPALKDAVVVAGAAQDPPERLLAQAKAIETERFDLRPLDVGGVASALAAFGVSYTAPEDVERLFEITSGRLDLLRDFATYILANPGSAIAGDLPAAYEGILALRVKSLSDGSPNLERILTALANFGEACARSDLQCVSGCSQVELEKVLQLASSEHLLDEIGEIVRFQNAAIHTYFHRISAAANREYHEKFAKCLAAMRPAEYGARQYHLALAGRLDEACSCYALAALAARRDHRAAPAVDGVSEAACWQEINAYIQTMRAAYDRYESGRPRDAMAELDRVETFLPEPLIAERDYLEAQVLLKSHSVVAYRRAVALLTSWRRLSRTEGELWARICQLLMIAFVQTDQVEEARRIEGEITAYYWKRRSVDPWAMYGLNVLRRRSESLHQLASATLRLESAIEYFGRRQPSGPVRHPLQYYCALTNLIGNLLANGRFADAHTRAAELQSYIREVASVAWPNLAAATNNVILAGYLSDHLDAGTAERLMRDILGYELEPTGDTILLENNWAVFTSLLGLRDEAWNVLAASYERLQESPEPDEYHVYVVGNNLAALHALRGDAEKGKQILSECATGLARMYPAIRETLRVRNEMIPRLLSIASDLSVEQFDSYLLKQYPMQLGPHWQFYGRGFLFSDIQFWSFD